MKARVPKRAAPAAKQIREQFAWLPNVLRVVAVPVLALLWWALAFLPWTHGAGARVVESWPPTLPVLFTDLGVAVFGSIGASLVVVALVRRGGLAFLSVLLGFGVSAWVTLTRAPGALRYWSAAPFYFSTTERNIMFAGCGVAALLGLALGAAAIRSLQAFGFLGLLAVSPVVSLYTVLLLDPGSDHLWLTRALLAALMVMIAWRRWTGMLVWPIFFALLWLLSLAMSAVEYGARTLHPPGGGHNSVGAVASAMLDFARSAWSVMLDTSWQLFWPAAVIAAIFIAALLGWRFVWPRVRQSPSSPG